MGFFIARILLVFLLVGLAYLVYVLLTKVENHDQDKDDELKF